MKETKIIKYEGDNSTFVWKHPAEDFDSLTQLIVHESQEAIFFMNGQALDLFGPGRYTLETENIPLLGKALKSTTGGKTPFHCEVYFINLTVQMGLKWGTDSKVRYLDPDSGIPMEIGASGEMNVQVIDSRKLLVKLIGTMKGIAWNDNGTGFAKSLQGTFRPLISTAVKSNLSPTIKKRGFNILEVDEHLEELSEALGDSIRPGLEEYGLTVPQFYVTTVVLPEEDPNFKRLKELHTVDLQTRVAQAEATVKTAQAQAEADVTAARRQVELEKQATQTAIARAQSEREIIEAQAKAQAAKLAGMAEAEVMQAKGYTQKDVLEADVQKAWAEGIGKAGSNGGGGQGGGLASDLVSMLAGVKMAEKVLDRVDNATTPVSQETVKEASAVCPSCGERLPSGAAFCFRCGAKIEANDGTVVCPHCGKRTPKGKFCIECGEPLAITCPQCGAPLVLGAKYCLECGAKIK